MNRNCTIEQRVFVLKTMVIAYFCQLNYGPCNQNVQAGQRLKKLGLERSLLFECYPVSTSRPISMIQTLYFYWDMVVSTLNLDLDFRSPNRPQKQVSKKVKLHRRGENNCFLREIFEACFLRPGFKVAQKNTNLQRSGNSSFNWSISWGKEHSKCLMRKLSLC